MADSTLDQQIRSVRAEVNDYLETVQGICALCHEIRFDPVSRQVRPEVRYCLGRRMTTSVRNRVQPDTAVSPDLVIQSDDTYGIVAEARLRFPRDAQERVAKLRQLEKYDDDLSGWYTEAGTVERFDIVLLTHDTSTVDASDFIGGMLQAGTATPSTVCSP